PFVKHPGTSLICAQKASILALNSSNNGADRDAAAQGGFLREVDDALRQDDLLRLGQRYGKPLAGVIIAGLLGLAGYLYYDHSRNQAAAELSERTILALDRLGSGGVAADAAARDLEPLMRDGAAGSRANATLLHAAILQQQGKGDQAAKEFAALAADAAAPQPFRDMALLRAVTLDFDKLAPADVVAKLKPLAIPGNPWFGSAGELTALAYLKLNQPDQAGSLLAAIGKNDQVSKTIRARARQLAGQLGYDAGVDMAQIEAAANAAGAPTPVSAAAQPAAAPAKQ
ncbi:MAG: hypothetical protein RIQ99_1709, partial [Pseudomonadota bacterium]